MQNAVPIKVKQMILALQEFVPIEVVSVILQPTLPATEKIIPIQ